MLFVRGNLIGTSALHLKRRVMSQFPEPSKLDQLPIVYAIPYGSIIFSVNMSDVIRTFVDRFIIQSYNRALLTDKYRKEQTAPSIKFIHILA